MKRDIQLFNDHFQNFKQYGIPKAQLIIADIPYNIGKDAYGSNPEWYVGGDIANGEDKSKAGKSFFDTDNDFRVSALYFSDACKGAKDERGKEQIAVYDCVLRI